MEPSMAGNSMCRVDLLISLSFHTIVLFPGMAMELQGGDFQNFYISSTCSDGCIGWRSRGDFCIIMLARISGVTGGSWDFFYLTIP
jgi:hypothetical protein